MLNENGVRISYERLFNMGSYEHEKYTISKDIDAGSELEAFKKLSLQIVDFEEDLNNYRHALNLLSSAKWDFEHAMGPEVETINIKLHRIEKAIKAFREAHKPVSKPCNCYWCTHPEWDSEAPEDFTEN